MSLTGWGVDDAAAVSALTERRGRSRALVRRSILIVPANEPRFVAKAHLRNADAVMLDLEDSVPAHAKDEARAAAADAVPQVSRGGADVLVRINKPYDLACRDLDAVVMPGLRGIWFPKVEHPEEVRTLDVLLTERERSAGITPGFIDIGVAIESAAGLFRAVEIAGASPRLVTLGYGSEDVALELEVEPTNEGHERFYGNALTIMAATSAGIQAIGRQGGIADFTNLEAWTASVRAARRLGFKGSGCIHPDQIPILNSEFSPSAAEVERARRVVAMFEDASALGRASANLDGSMIDTPTYVRAKQTLDRQAAIERANSRKLTAVRGGHGDFA